MEDDFLPRPSSEDMDKLLGDLKKDTG